MKIQNTTVPPVKVLNPEKLHWTEFVSVENTNSGPLKLVYIVIQLVILVPIVTLNIVSPLNTLTLTLKEKMWSSTIFSFYQTTLELIRKVIHSLKESTVSKPLKNTLTRKSMKQLPTYITRKKSISDNWYYKKKLSTKKKKKEWISFQFSITLQQKKILKKKNSSKNKDQNQAQELKKLKTIKSMLILM